MPPRKLYLPVLPAKISNKLVFALCRKCAETKCKECKHSEKERSLKGTWVTLEVQKAIQLGYKVIEIYEVWHWDESEEYNGSGGLFTEYVNPLLKGNIHLIKKKKNNLI